MMVETYVKRGNMKKLLALSVLIMILGCSGPNKVKISGTITKQSDSAGKFFVVKDNETGKLYRFSKKSEKDISDKIGHSIKMKGKILESSDTATVDTVSICTKCHHSYKIY